MEKGKGARVVRGSGMGGEGIGARVGSFEGREGCVGEGRRHGGAVEGWQDVGEGHFWGGEKAREAWGG